MTWRARLGAPLALSLGLLAAEGVVRGALSTPSVQDRLRGVSPAGAVLTTHLSRDQKVHWMGADGAGPVVHDPDLGWRNRPGAHPFPYGHVLPDGARRRAPPDPDARRVVVIGDSFAYGYGVADGLTLADRVEARLDGVTARTMAVPGWSHEQMLRQWTRDGATWQAEVVVLVLVLADVGRNGVPATDYLKPWASSGGADLVWHGLPVPAPDALTPPSVATWALVRALVDRSPTAPDQIALSAQVVGALAQAVGSSAPLVVLSAPTPMQPDYGRTDGRPAPTAAGGPVFAAACEHAVACLDGTDAVRAALDAGASGDSLGHWDAPVTDALADLVAPAIDAALP